jgi:hypothetical protein
MTGYRQFVILMLATASMACSTAENGQDKNNTTGTTASSRATVLLYQEQEAGTDSYPVRILVSPEYLRIDDGYAESDFALLDREARTVFSVSHDDRSILVVRGTTVDRQVPPGIHMELEQEVDTNAPTVAGMQPVHVRFIANKTLCHEAMVVPGLLKDAVDGLIEYEEILASRQQENLSTTPESLQSPCFLMRFVYAPARHLRQGIPIQEWDDAGYHRSLTDYREAEQVTNDLFRLPDGYERFSLSEVSDP